MKVLVLGHQGMLGRYVYKYLIACRSYKVTGLGRDKFDASDYEKYNHLIQTISGYDVVVNCMGTIKPVVSSVGTKSTFMVNSVFPHYLSRICAKQNIPLIHITTDCVYSGKTGGYDELDASDVLDDYGLSKSIGDFCGAPTVIRTSIIGEEVENKRSLLEWAISQKGKEVKGFTNHLWSGMTCLELAKVVEDVIRTKNSLGVCHLFSAPISKHDLLGLISDVYELNLDIKAYEASQGCNRTLVSRKYYSHGIDIQPLRKQLEDLKAFSSRLYSD